MRLLSPRLLVVLAVVVLAWGGAHLLGTHDAAVTPATWPTTQPAASPTPRAAAVLPIAGANPPASPDSGIPVLPGVMRQLNANTRDTAIGLYALVQQFEAALRSHLDALARQLEPGR